MKGLIYKITHKDTPEKIDYVGSTYTFGRRRAQHKYNVVKGKEYERPIYNCVREGGGWNNFKMEMLETLEDCDVKMLRLREKELIKTLQPTHNIYHLKTKH